MKTAFRLGGRGLCVKDLQRRLGLVTDGEFGPITREAVARRQRILGQIDDGEAGEAFFEAIQIPWPSQFERCLNLTCAFEGTEYGDLNQRDIDGAGITLGIIGFTSKHGQVQPLVRAYLKANPSAYNDLGTTMAGHFRRLMISELSTPTEWEGVFYGENGRIRPEVAVAVRVWGKDPIFQKLQRSFARDKVWAKSCAQASALKLETMGGYGLMFDIAVQNGGFGERHRLAYQKQSQDGSQESRLRAIAKAVGDESAAPWRTDVFKRKMVFAEGAGTVHGAHYDLAAMAFDL